MRTVSIAARNLIIKQPFYGMFLTTLHKGFNDEIPTAGVSVTGLTFKLDINKDFWYKLSADQKMGILMHELIHLAYHHLFMRKSFSDMQLFNIAADLEVNQYIPPNWLPEGALTLNMFPNICMKYKAGTKYYYEQLEQNLKSKNPDQTLKRLMDSDLIHPTWDEFDEMMEDDNLEGSTRALMEAQLDTQLQQSTANISRGIIPSNILERLDKLFKIEAPIFNWKAYFRRYMGQSFNIFTKKSYKSQSSRFEDSPGLKIKKRHHILVAIDTSMSIDNNDFYDFFSEIHNIYKTNCSIDIIECDTRIGNKYSYKGKMPKQISGRGGTIFEPVIEYYNQNRRKYTTLIYFTDGYGESKIKKPLGSALWVVTANGKDQKDYYPGYMIKIPKK